MQMVIFLGGCQKLLFDTSDVWSPSAKRSRPLSLCPRTSEWEPTNLNDGRIIVGRCREAIRYSDHDMKTFEGRGHAATNLHGSCTPWLSSSENPITQDNTRNMWLWGLTVGKFLADLVHAMGGAVNAVRFREINLLSHKLVNSCRICKDLLIFL